MQMLAQFKRHYQLLNQTTTFVKHHQEHYAHVTAEVCPVYSPHSFDSSACGEPMKVHVCVHITPQFNKKHACFLIPTYFGDLIDKSTIVTNADVIARLTSLLDRSRIPITRMLYTHAHNIHRAGVNVPTLSLAHYHLYHTLLKHGYTHAKSPNGKPFPYIFTLSPTELMQFVCLVPNFMHALTKDKNAFTAFHHDSNLPIFVPFSFGFVIRLPNRHGLGNRFDMILLDNTTNHDVKRQDYISKHLQSLSTSSRLPACQIAHLFGLPLDPFDVTTSPTDVPFVFIFHKGDFVKSLGGQVRCFDTIKDAKRYAKTHFVDGADYRLYSDLPH